MNEYKLGSLFDGSGGFPLAGVLCGVTPRWASEVEPYPIAVTTKNFPEMKHLGDISKVNGGEIEPVDIITFGSPCQDLSVAGKRAGLKHETNGDDETTRSGLFMEAVRIIKEMRQATNGKYPTFALWENVPGAFSSNKGEDFRTVLEELIKVVEPSASMPEVPPNGWSYSDCYIGDGWSLAYRVLDAQYWGVPQRRRRVYLVADFRGERARSVLFERDSLLGYFTQGRTPWQGTPSDAQGGTVADDSTRGSGGPVVGLDAFNQSATGDKACSLRCKGDNEHQPCVVYGLDRASFNQGENAKFDFQVTPPVAGFCTEHSAKARSIGYEEEVTPTLRAGVTPAVVYATEYTVVAYGFDRYNQCSTGEQSETIRTPGGGDNYATCYYSVENHTADSRLYIVRRLTPTECARLQGFPDNWGDLTEKTHLSKDELHFWQEVRNTHANINGRATKDYTEKQMLAWYNKLESDSAKYKMWGNGIALPTALYCMQGIVDALERTEQ